MKTALVLVTVLVIVLVIVIVIVLVLVIVIAIIAIDSNYFLSPETTDEMSTGINNRFYLHQQLLLQRLL